MQAAAKIFNIEIFVVSSLGPDATADIAKKSIIPMAQIQLGHFAEGDGDHYVCVGGDFQSDEQSIEDIDHQLLENRPEEEQEPQKSQKLKNARVWTAKLPIREYSEQWSTNSFCPNSTLIRNNLMRSVNNSHDVVLMEILPIELIDMIIKMAVYSSGLSWPNHVCRVYNQIYNVNRLFRDCVKKLRAQSIGRIRLRKCCQATVQIGAADYFLKYNGSFLIHDGTEHGLSFTRMQMDCL